MNNTESYVNASIPVQVNCRQVERVGPCFSAFIQRLHVCNKSEDYSKEHNLSDHHTDDIEFLRSLDPKEWKDQDHYAVLGLKAARFQASEDTIRRAYRKMLLKHHPDKRKAKGEKIITEDDYFTCITKAYEILGTPKTRRAYDSVDPEFDDNLPTAIEIENNFYKCFEKCFNLNARWSEKKNVPVLGNEESTRENVDNFYTFWYGFESWREFSYLDEEDKEKGQDREERRWIEKQNKVARIKRKKEEMSRIRALVDLSYNNDPRITKFKLEEKQKKLAAKRAKMDAAQAAKAEEERIIKEANLAKERLELAEQKRIEQIRLEKEQQKKAMKKEKKILRDKVKENNYYSSDDIEKIKHMEGVEKICETLKLLDLQNLNKEIENDGKNTFLRALKEVEKKIELERETMMESNNKNNFNNNISIKVVDKNAAWSNENMQLLIKAVNLFPAGTAQRWEVIAAFLNQHSSTDIKFIARDVLNKAKDLQSSDFSKNVLKSQANDSAFESFEKNKKDLKKIDKADISVYSENADKIKGVNKNNSLKKESPEIEIKMNGTIKNTEANMQKQQLEPKSWTKEQQALLEQAIKTYPISTPDRWDRIAECIPNRTKKDCLKRVKELVERVNAKKEAQQACK